MVDGQSEGNLHVTIQAGEFNFASGVSRAQGGGGEAPDPHALLEASLSACTILTLELYAKRKEWKLGTVSCQVRIEKEGASGTEMIRTLTISEKLTPEIRARLLEIANKCPIHKILSGSVAIQTQMSEA